MLRCPMDEFIGSHAVSRQSAMQITINEIMARVGVIRTLEITKLSAIGSENSVKDP